MPQPVDPSDLPGWERDFLDKQVAEQPEPPTQPDEPAGRRLMDIGEFRRLGYLQELNRQFLHPLGMALAVTVDPDGTERLNGVWDDRDDPEGIRYAPGVLEPAKTERVAQARRRMADSRIAVLGYVVQPVDGADAPEPATPPDPTHGRIDRDIQAAVDDWGPKSLGQRVAIESTLQAERDAGREPLTLPAQQPHDAPAGDDGHPGTPDGPAVLGRALLDEDGDFWLERDSGMWQCGSVTPRSREAAAQAYGPLTEVLLVRPEVGRVLAAARMRVALIHESSGKTGVRPEVWADEDELELIAAVDVLNRAVAESFAEQPTTCGPDHDVLTGVTAAEMVVHHRQVMETLRRYGQPIPPMDLTDAEREAALAEVEGREPAAIDAAHIERQRQFGTETFGPGLRLGVIDHIRKELTEVEADPTDLAEWVDVIILGFDGAWRAGHEPQAIIDAIKAKQARNEARTWPDWRTADRDKAIEHDRTAEPAPEPAGDGPGWSRQDVTWLVAHLREHWRDGRPTMANPALADQVETLLASYDDAAEEIAELREMTATCACGDGNPETYEGPQPDCPVHGAVRAFNEASRELTEVRDELDRLKELANRQYQSICVLTDDRDSAQSAQRATDADLQATAATADKLRAELATARRNAAADALEFAAGMVGDPVGSLTALAHQFRTGVRAVPERGDLGQEADLG